MNIETSEPIEAPGTGGTDGRAQSHGEAPRWSDRATRRLTQARVIGVLAAVLGAILFVVGESRSTITTNLMSSSGLTLLVVGLSLIGEGLNELINPLSRQD